MTDTTQGTSTGGERPVLRPYDDSLRRDLSLAATRALSKGGPAGLSIRSLAREAGTSTQAVYSLFGGKTGLVDAVLAEGFAQLSATLRAVVADEDGVETVKAQSHVYRRWALDNAPLYTAMFAARGRGIDVGGLRAARDGSRVKPMAEHIPPELYAAMESAVIPLMVQAYRVVEKAHPHIVGTDEARARAHDLARAVWSGVHGWVDLELSGLTTRWPPRSRFEGDEAFHVYVRALVAGMSGCGD